MVRNAAGGEYATGPIRKRRAREATTLSGLLKDVSMVWKEMVWKGLWELP